MNQLPEEHIEKRGIRDPRVLHAIRSVPRHLFVRADQAFAAYEDRPLKIGFGATISQPYIVAAMTELLDLRSEDKVLEIGTGSGYQSAVLSLLVRDVFSMEIVPELARLAVENLQRLGYANVQVRIGDGYEGWPEYAPFDRILLTAAPPEIPQELLVQLRTCGRLVAPVGRTEQDLLVVDKEGESTYRRRTVFPVSFVSMVGLRQ